MNESVIIFYATINQMNKTHKDMLVGIGSLC